MLPPTFLEFRGRWNITHWTCVSRAWGRGRGTHRGPPTPQRLVFGSGLPQSRPCDTQELINTLEEKIGVSCNILDPLLRGWGELNWALGNDSLVGLDLGRLGASDHLGP